MGEWAVRSEDGRTCRASEEVARAAVTEGGYTVGPNRSPIVAALTRDDPADEWREFDPTAPDSTPTEREAGDAEVAAVREVVSGVYRRHDVHAPLNHVNVEEWVAALAPLMAERERAAVQDYIERRATPTIKVDLTNDESKWLLDAARAEAGARALREAAEVTAKWSAEESPDAPHFTDWLRDRAAALAPEAREDQP